MNSRFTFVVISCLFITGICTSQTKTQASLSKASASVERPDFGNDNQPASEPVIDSENPEKVTEKTLAKQDKSTYILSNHAPSQSTSSVTTYDFTASADMYYGGSSGAKDLGDGKWGMIAGDANGDGGVYTEDLTLYYSNQGNEGYQTEDASDFNCDGGVYTEDLTIYFMNQGSESYVP